VSALSTALRKLAPVDDASLARALADFSPRVLKPGEHLLRAGDLARVLAFVEHGLVREYYVSPNGDEHVRSFVSEGMFTGSLSDLLSGKPALVNIEALEPTRLHVCSWVAHQARCEREPAWHVAGRRQAEWLYCKKAVREYQMLAFTARERFEAFRREYPELEPRVGGRHLASYLGITPEHLSRIRGPSGRTPARRSR
jgi:CRP-like cAMP-binding protein